MTELATMDASTPAASDDGKIVCHIDGARIHSVALHIKKNYADTWTIDRYKVEFPGEPLLSKLGEQTLARAQAKRDADAAAATRPAQAASPAENGALIARTAHLHELFGLGNTPAAMSSRGSPISIKTFTGHDDQALLYLPEIDSGYVFNIDLLKKVIIGYERSMNVYLWGWHGSGKTTVLEQAAAYTRRPFLRVQHTLNMQESEVIGQWTVRDGSTIFQLGPLPQAMLNGWVYCADEYDRGLPGVIALYQGVLERKPLIIKDAPPQFRSITPHPDFCFVATGNTNGIGDETGLYQGTIMQDAANYSRFHITQEVTYMDAKIETAIVASKASIDEANASKLVKFANEVRSMFAQGKINMTISTREIVNAGVLGLLFGAKWTTGIELAFANRLNRVDRKTVLDYCQRVFAE